jgi:phage shock protein A
VSVLSEEIPGMTMIDRIARLFRADIHDLLDRIEEPAVVLRQAVRDMENELNLDEREILKLEREAERLSARLQEIDGSLGEIESQLDVCFESEKEDLARRLIRRRLEMQSLRKQLAKKGAGLDETLARRRKGFQENQSRLEEIRQKAELLAAEEPDETLHEEPRYSCESVIRDEDVEVAFLKEQQKRRQS